MPKVLIMSDSHGLTEEILEIKNRHDIDHMIHCGDSELEMDTPEMAKFLKVGGNCDFDDRYPDEQVHSVDGLHIFITHGHLHDVKSNLMKLSYRAEENSAKVICYGHTHIAGAQKVADQLFINPGSVRLPRNRPEKTYALMEWESKDNISITFFSLSGEQVKELSYTTTLS
ncbi:metallophosphoesterase family protein [Virgibacillus byunsanensis]|uniref:Phosphoesterase n=1 Tax=Virgibacillus byunsanensis TaxID=570945 RepID=A0ABW3LQD7_9BACI